MRKIVLAVGIAVLSACGDGSPGSAATSGSAAVEAPPLPPPEDLAMECVLPTPDATWSKARAQIGGAAAFLPTTAGGLVAVTLHFPLAVSEAIDGRVPAVCAATLAKDAESPRLVLGVHLRWPDRLIDGLTKGSEARFNARSDATTGIQILEPRDPKDAIAPSGVLGNYLLVASRAEDLVALGPYVARGMPARAKDFPTAGVRIAGESEQPPFDLVARVPAAAIRGPITAASSRAWSAFAERLAEKLPMPLPFAEDARAALAVLPDVDGAELRVTLGDQGARLEASAPLRPGTAGETAARALTVGDASPLLALPKDTLAAILARRSLGAPTAAPTTKGAPSANSTANGAPSANSTASAAPSANNVTAAIAKALGVDDAKEAAKIEAVTKAFNDARGEWTTAGFAFDGTGPSAFVRASVRDAGALDGALKDFLALADGARPTDPVKGAKLKMTAGKTVLENIPGDVYRLRLARSADAAKKGAEPPAAPTETPAAVDLLFRRADDVLVAAAGYASRDALRAVLAAPTGDSLQKVPDIATPVTALGSGVALALFFDPVRIAASRAGKPGSGTPAPVVIALGRDGAGASTMFLRAFAPTAALGEMSRWIAP